MKDDQIKNAFNQALNTLIDENQRHVLDQDLYQSRHTELDTVYQKALASKHALEIDIAANTAKHTACTTALSDVIVERMTGIEPAPPVWKTGALPLSYIRVCLSKLGAARV